MNFFRFRGVFDQDTDEMAKPRKLADPERVQRHLDSLVAAGIDRAAFTTAVAALENDADVTASDLIAVAHQFNRGGAKPTSRAKALALLKKRHVEIIRTEAKNKIAEKARPW